MTSPAPPATPSSTGAEPAGYGGGSPARSWLIAAAMVEATQAANPHATRPCRRRRAADGSSPGYAQSAPPPRRLRSVTACRSAAARAAGLARPRPFVARQYFAADTAITRTLQAAISPNAASSAG
jgi:hypothetical protein